MNLNTEEKKETESTQQTPAEEKQEQAVPETKEPQNPSKADKKEKKAKKKTQEDALKADLETAKAEAAKQKDLLLRTAAEYDNFRKRTEREKSALYAGATADAVQEFLPVADNLERALSQPDCSVEDLRKGIEMVQKQMDDALEKLGVEPMGKEGEPFDAQLHNAVSHIESEELGENVIAQVYQKGYRMGSKVVRHAMVQVAN
ncbi:MULTISPECIES: nucleotide exchange factor GrpE [Caproicibacterium]|uniref:Protein GrpE n=1 Tax=Caproicibacterium argilliputei TaxID=3030016 RepID=A0AA97H188_9FIRM|nr:nucleotide exchange factor GrpE [Caproicibacterium argilliputei]WOC32173.1 nucleotide exchange factor GrpE [Caproicibacterium argilliputei]